MKTDLDIPKETTQLSQSGPKVMQSQPHKAKVTPKEPQSDLKVIPKYPESALASLRLGSARLPVRPVGVLRPLLTPQKVS